MELIGSRSEGDLSSSLELIGSRSEGGSSGASSSTCVRRATPGSSSASCLASASWGTESYSGIMLVSSCAGEEMQQEWQPNCSGDDEDWRSRLLIEEPCRTERERELQLHQEVVALARGLGIGYLWIDALCIIQDSDKDKDKELRKMCDIYRGALVVVVATTASSPSDSLLRVKPQPGQSHTWRTASRIRYEEDDLKCRGWYAASAANSQQVGGLTD